MITLPKTLERIPLEYVDRALAAFAADPGVDGRRLAVLGWSRGGELALLTAARHPELRAAVAYVPSHVAWSGIGGAAPGGRGGPVAAWTVGGVAVPFVVGRPTPEHYARWQRGGTVSGAEITAASLAADTAAVARAAIPIERIGGPVVLVAGADDHVWGSAQMTALAAARLRAAGFPHLVTALVYPGAGHWIVVGYGPRARSTGSGQFDPGGSPAADARAAAAAWPQVLATLRRALGT